MSEILQRELLQWKLQQKLAQGARVFNIRSSLTVACEHVNGVRVKDSNETHHMYYDKANFNIYHKLKKRLFVGGIKDGVSAVGIGSLTMMAHNKNACVLENVFYVPRMKLMLLTQLALKG